MTTMKAFLARERKKALAKERAAKRKAAKAKPKPKLIASNRLDFDLDFMWGDEAP